jgi:hypothetical protein
MNNAKTVEKDLIRSSSLAILSSVIVSAFILLPFISKAGSPVNKNKEAAVYMHAFKASKKASVTLYNFEEGKYNLTIEGAKGVYYDALLESAEGFAKVFDLNNLEDGEYTLSVKNNKNVETRKFTIKEGEVEVFYQEKVQPYFSTNGSKARLILPNTYGNSVDIKVIDQAGDALYSTQENTDAVHKVFDFSEVASGNYTVNVKAGGNNFAFDYKK